MRQDSKQSLREQYSLSVPVIYFRYRAASTQTSPNVAVSRLVGLEVKSDRDGVIVQDAPVSFAIGRSSLLVDT
jgi:hypothetical protein